MFKTVLSIVLLLSCLCLSPGNSSACSTFKLQKGGEFFLGHNLDEPGKNISGMIYINKRGVFKIGRSFTEIFVGDEPEGIYTEFVVPSDFCWISRFGSITFSPWGRDFPDGGINEAGLYIWEMGLAANEYPQNDKLHKLMQSNWVQYILDNFCTLDEAISSAYDFELMGLNWHFFLADADGRCAIIEFLDGKVVIHRDEEIPIPGLFNLPYDREMDFLHLFKGFGGLYEPDINDPKVPRMVKTALMLKEYDPAVHDALEYSKSLLWEVGNKPYKWGILIDVVRKKIHFNTENTPEWKTFSYKDIDFSNNSPVLTLNIDQQKGGDVLDRFHPQQDSEVIENIMAFGLSDEFYKYFHNTREKFAERSARAYHEAEKPERQYFAGIWKGECTKADENGKRDQVSLELKTDGSNVAGSINFRGDEYPIQHISLLDKKLTFSFRSNKGSIIVGECQINDKFINLNIDWTGGTVGKFLLEKQ